MREKPRKLMPEEIDLKAALAESHETLGRAIPRLITLKPQVEINGMTHGLSGQYTYLTPAQLIEYAAIGARTYQDLKPVGIREMQLTQRIIDLHWRLNHMPQHYAAIPPEADQAVEMAKLARYQNTLERLSAFMCKDFDRTQDERRSYTHWEIYDIEKNEGYKKFNELLALAMRLVEARRELATKSQVEENIDPAAPELGLQKRLKIVMPLTKKGREILDLARDWELLNPIECTAFPRIRLV